VPIGSGAPASDSSPSPLADYTSASGRDIERGQARVDGIRVGGGTADFVQADLRDESSAKALAAPAVEIGGGPVNVLVNSAGIFPFGPTSETSAAGFDEVFDVNVKAPYFLVAALAPAMAARGDGAIVNVTTMVAEFGAAGMGLYGSSKAALVLLSEFGPSGVRVNAVSPGPTCTEGTAAMGESLDALAAADPAGRPGTAQEIAEAIVFLATGAASFVHGVALPVDGGRIPTSMSRWIWSLTRDVSLGSVRSPVATVRLEREGIPDEEVLGSDRCFDHGHHGARSDGQSRECDRR
jgi:NAD(P)-dependent dehydrogenase (short-subunit alcohol dehydrogenase family)